MPVNIPPPPAGMNPLEYGNLLLGGQARTGGSDPFALQQNIAAQQQAQQPDPEAEAQAMLEEVEGALKETTASNKLKEKALKLKQELDKSRQLEEQLAADPEAAALFEKLTSREAETPEPPVQ